MNAVVREEHDAGMLAVAKLALSLSDVDFLRWLIMDSDVYVPSEVNQFVRGELEFYRFSESEEAYRAHYAKYEGAFFAGPVRSFVRADWRRDPRYLAILRAVRAMEPACVLDFGCSTGHITRQLALDMPDTGFVGVDITPQAAQWFNSLAPRNAKAYTIDEWRRTEQLRLFDVIVCAEVLEHVIDPYQTLDDLEECLAPEGAFVCTLPFGPWESQGWTKEDPYAREHLRHWGAAELRDVFGPTTLAWHVGATDMGQTVTLSGRRVGKVDMESKLARYERLVGGI